MAARLAAVVRELPGVEITRPVQANAVFARATRGGHRGAAAAVRLLHLGRGHRRGALDVRLGHHSRPMSMRSSPQSATRLGRSRRIRGVAKRTDVDLSLSLSKAQEAERLGIAQRRLLALRPSAGGLIGDGTLGPPVCLVFEGWDAAGKGGAIRRLTGPLDPRHVSRPVRRARPREEKRHHFLWRFWPPLPGLGRDDGVRPLLVRPRAGRAGRGIRHATASGGAPTTRSTSSSARWPTRGWCVVKFWLHISDEEQLRRFEAAEDDPLKAWKLTDEDWRNREKRPAYEQAVPTMLQRTEHVPAPWGLISAEDKRHARVAVLEATVAAIEQGMRDRGAVRSRSTARSRSDRGAHRVRPRAGQPDRRAHRLQRRPRASVRRSTPA